MLSRAGVSFVFIFTVLSSAGAGVIKNQIRHLRKSNHIRVSSVRLARPYKHRKQGDNPRVEALAETMQKKVRVTETSRERS